MASQGKIQIGSRGTTVDASGFLAHLRDFSVVMGRNIGDVILDQAGKFCLDMVNYSRPFTSKTDGGSPASRKKGLGNIKKSLYKIFQPIDKATPEEIADINDYGVFKLWSKRTGSGSRGKTRWVQFQKKFATGKTVGFIPAGGSGTIESFHSQARTDDGHGPLKSSYRQTKGPIFIVAKESDIKSVIKKRSESVGRLKSAYYFSALNVGSKERFPAWVQNPKGATNAIAVNQILAPELPSVTVGNTVGRRGMRGVENAVQVALNHRAYAMRVLIAQRLKKEGKTVWGAFQGGQGLTSHRSFT